jgi:protein CpxP
MRKLLLATTLCLGVAGVALAQPAPPPGGPAGGPGMGRGGMACAVQDGRLTRFLDRIHERLQITPSETPAWEQMDGAITQAVQPLAVHCHEPRANLRAMPLPARMQRMLELGNERAQVMAKVQQAVATMYAQLTPDQQKVADGLMRGPHHMRGPRHGGPARGPGAPAAPDGAPPLPAPRN